MQSKSVNSYDSLVSVVIPIHNAAFFIEQTILALLKSGGDKIELVCIFDNCVDNSFQVVKDLLDKKGFENYQLIETQNGSTAESRNNGLESASHKYVAFVDHDDIIDSNFYERALLYAEKTEADVVRCGYAIVDNGIHQFVESLPNQKNYPFRGMFIWNAVYRKDFLLNKDIKFLKGYGEDYEFNLSLLSNGAKEGRLGHNSVYYQWRHHDNNLHKKRTAYDFINRARSMIVNHYNYFERDGEASINMSSWVVDYVLHLIGSGHLHDIADAYTKEDTVRLFLEKNYLGVVENNNVRKLFKKNNKDDFVALAKKLESKKKFRKRYRKFLSKGEMPLKKLFNLYRSSNSFISFLKSFVKIVLRKIKYSLDFRVKNKGLIDERVSSIKETEKNKAVFYVFRKEFISGGLISIYSIAEKLRKYNIEPVLVGDPGAGTVPRNKLFPNREVTLPWGRFLKENIDYKYVFIPEVKVKEFLGLVERHKIDLTGVTVNILNQNNELMPREDVVKKISNICNAVTMTTAHLKYTSQEVSDKWGVPVKHISTYLSYKDYFVQPYEEKYNLVLYSPDSHPLKGRIMHDVWKNFKKWEHKTVIGLNYDDYKKILQSAKYSVSFGEGLDNYFIEPFFSGGIGITVFNPEFMDKQFLELDNVFSSYAEMERTLSSLIEKMDSDESYRISIWKKNFEILSRLYDGDVYEKKLSEYVSGEYDYWPKCSG